MRRAYPPEYDNEPTCRVCDDPPTLESTEDGAPLCEEHDTEISREYHRLNRDLGKLSEDLYELEMKMTQRRRDDEDLERLSNRHKQVRSNKQKVNQQLEDLQERCPHEDLEVTREIVTEDDFIEIHEGEMADKIPFYRVYEHCPECEHRNHYTEKA